MLREHLETGLTGCGPEAPVRCQHTPRWCGEFADRAQNGEADMNRGNIKRAGEMLIISQGLKTEGLGKAPPGSSVEQQFSGLSEGVLSFTWVICDELLKESPKNDYFESIAESFSCCKELSLSTFPSGEIPYLPFCLSVYNLFSLRETVPEFLFSSFVLAGSKRILLYLNLFTLYEAREACYI